MPKNLQTLLPILLAAVLLAALGFWGIRGTPDDAPEPPTKPAPRAAMRTKASPRVVAPRPGTPAREAPPRPAVRNVTSMPTRGDVDAAFDDLVEISLRPSVSAAAGSAFDLEVSRLLHEKTLALRYFDQIVRAAVIGGVLTEEEAAAKRSEAREDVATALADIPVPSYLEDPDTIAAYRARMAERALAVLDEGADPGDPNAGVP